MLMRYLIILGAIAGYWFPLCGETVFTDGFLREFMISKPMPSVRADEIETQLPEINTADWQTISVRMPVVELQQIFPSDNLNNVAVFAAADINVASGGEGIVTLGSDDGARLWLNGQLIIDSDKKRGCIPDEDRVNAAFLPGKNRILVRVNNIDGHYAFAVRAAVSDRQKQLVTYTLQPPKEKWSGNFTRREMVDDLSYRFLTAEPFVKRGANIAILNGMMAGAHRPSYPFYRKNFDGSEMPKPDYLDIRMPFYALGNPQSGAPGGFLYGVMEAAKNSPIPEIDLSLTSSSWQSWREQPELAPNFKDFFAEKFPDMKLEYMRDFSGNLLNDNNSNRYLVSYDQIALWTFVNETAAIAGSLLKQHPEWRTGALHVRGPSSNDWYYPSNGSFCDYSALTQQSFREFLRQKYGSIDNLNREWRSEYAGFDKVNAPMPRFNRYNLSRSFQDWQQFRFAAVIRVQRDILNAVKKQDSGRRQTSWMTTALATAARDGILLDDAMQLGKEFPDTLMTLTCFDYLASGMPLSGELFGQLALAYQVSIAVEPLEMNEESFLKTYYNLLRFPVKKVCWLFWCGNIPASRPWMVWVLNQRGVADELADAKLVQEDVVNLFSYSDLVLRVPQTLHDSEITDQYNFFRALQASNINLPMLTDYSTSVDLGRYRGMVIAEQKLIRPEMIQKIGKFVRNGGRLLLVGSVGEYDLNTGENNHPLLRELEYTEGKNEWSLGSGTVLRHPESLNSLLTQDKLPTPDFLALLQKIGVKNELRLETPGLAASFVKQKGTMLYLGFFNVSQSTFSTTAEYTGLRGTGKLVGTDMVTGKNITIDNGRFELAFDVPWQIAVIQLDLSGSSKH